MRIAEVFNVFNRPNYGIGTQENNCAVPEERVGADADDAVRVQVDVLREQRGRTPRTEKPRS